MTRVLLVEDDSTLRTGLGDALLSEGFELVAAPDGFEGQRQLREGGFALVILDLMLPGPGGLELLRELRQSDTVTPVLLLTARGDENDKVLGLELGADDYVTKPFGLRELLARVRALLRRSQPAAEVATQRFCLGDADVDLAAFLVVRDGVETALSKKEAAMLQLLVDRRGEAVSRRTFLTLVWGSDEHVNNRTIDTHMLNLRQKVEADPKRPVHLITVHGVGYRLENPAT